MNAKAHFQSVHLLRGIAAFLVVSDHAFGEVPYLAWFNHLGDLGVVCFFVISGFAIAHSLGDAYQTRDFARFFARRLVRIEPTYLASIAISCLVIAILPRAVSGGTPWPPTASGLLSHAFYLVPFTGERWIIPAYWSLAVEFQFYLAIGLLYPALLFAERRWRHAMFACMILFAALAFLAPYCKPLRLLEFCPFFALGVLLARSVSRPLDPRLLWGAALALCAIAYLCGLRRAACVGLITAAVIHFWPADRRLSGKPARACLFLGTISYSWYVIHTVIQMAGEAGAMYLSGLDAYPLQQWMVNLVPLAGFAASIPAAWLLHVAVEGPTHRLARKIALQPADVRRPG